MKKKTKTKWKKNQPQTPKPNTQVTPFSFLFFLFFLFFSSFFFLLSFFFFFFLAFKCAVNRLPRQYEFRKSERWKYLICRTRSSVEWVLRQKSKTHSLMNWHQIHYNEIITVLNPLFLGSTYWECGICQGTVRLTCDWRAKPLRNPEQRAWERMWHPASLPTNSRINSLLLPLGVNVLTNSNPAAVASTVWRIQLQPDCPSL